jgi:hypothetical protein
MDKNRVVAEQAPRLFLLATGLCLSAYIFARACLLSFTHDEALTIMTYVTQPWKNLLRVDWTNNHLLNSILTRFCLEWFGPSEISLRLPNVISGIIFLIFAGKLSKKIAGRGWKGCLLFLFITCNPFLLDFFSLCRGYGISMGFLMAGLFYFYRYIESTNRFFSFLSFTFSAIALTANYTLLNFFLIQVACFILWEIITFTKITWKKQAAGFVLTLVPVAFFLRWFLRLIFDLRQYGNFNFGGTNGFWKDSVGSLLSYSLGIFGTSQTAIIVFSGFIIALIIAGTCFILFNLRKTKTVTGYFTVFLLLGMTGCAIALWLQNVYMQMPYSMDRTVLYFLVLFPLFLAGCFYTAGSFSRLRFAGASLFLLFPFLAFLFSANLHTTLLWADNANVKEGVGIIINDSKPLPGHDEIQRVGVSFIDYPVYNYYLYKEKAGWLDHAYYGDFGLLPGTKYNLVTDEVDMHPEGYEEVWKKDSLVLLQKKAPWIYNTVFSVREDFEYGKWRKRSAGYKSRYALLHDSDPGVMNIIDTILPEGIEGPVTFRVKADLQSAVEFSGARIAIKIWHDSALSFFYEYPVSWYLYKPRAWNHFEHYRFSWEKLFKGDRIVCFIRNEENNTLLADNFSFSILK